MRLIDAGIAVLLLVFAYVQLNDPDPGYWVLVYAGSAAVFLAAVVGRYSNFVAAALVGAVVAGMVIALPGFLDYFQSQDASSLVGAMLPEKPWVEPAREFFGLAINLGLLVWYLRRSKRVQI